MFFEGSEKKAEVIVSTDKLNLLTDFDPGFWQQLVENCQAKILSSVENHHCVAYLLSESSLFVWADRFVILTCGETRLVDSIHFFLQQVDEQAIEHVIYQRKNEYFSHIQPSNVLDDIKKLESEVRGQSYRFGAMDSHHTFMFHQDNDFQADKNDKTYELLAYQISEQASDKLTRPNLTKQNIRDFLQLETLIPGFEINDYVFEPFGYSLNAIKGQDYFTIHITPQSHSSYVSFESSLDLLTMAPVILAILQPASFDVISFNEDEFAAKAARSISNEYVSKERVEKQMDNGYRVNFANFIRPQQHTTQPTKLILEGEHYVF